MNKQTKKRRLEKKNDYQSETPNFKRVELTILSFLFSTADPSFLSVQWMNEYMAWTCKVMQAQIGNGSNRCSQKKK